MGPKMEQIGSRLKSTLNVSQQPQMSYSLNSFKGDYMGACIGDYYGGY